MTVRNCVETRRARIYYVTRLVVSVKTARGGTKHDDTPASVQSRATPTLHTKVDSLGTIASTAEWNGCRMDLS